jgi:hypothetical protein
MTCFTPGNYSIWLNDKGASCIDQTIASLQGVGSYASRLQAIQAESKDFIDKFLQDYGDKPLSDMSNIFLSYCQQTGGVCNGNLISYCQSAANIDKEDNINSYLCGCIAPPSIKEGQPGFAPECYYSCQRQNVIPVFNINNGDIITCNDSVCIIDNVTSNLSSSLTVEQSCGECTLGQCRCTISGKPLKTVLSSISNVQDILSFCSSTRCFDNDKEVDCKTNIDEIMQTKSNDSPSFLPYLIILLVIIFILFVAFIYRLRDKT